MKQTSAIFLTFFLTFTAITLFGQLSVTTNNSQPDNSAMLDVKSTTKGFLPPRMTTTEQNSIVSPVAGLIVFNTDTKSINVFSGNSWISLFPLNYNWKCGAPFTDTRDGMVYGTIMIGMQCWMKDDLNYGTRIDGSLNQSNNGLGEKYCYNNLESNCAIYGGLYQWDEVMNYTSSSNSNPSGRQGLCPDGWHIPSDAEWCQMECFLDGTVNCALYGWVGTDAGGKMKDAGNQHWPSPNTGASNSSGFTGLPGGYRTNAGGFANLLTTITYWSSKASSASHAWYSVLQNPSAQIGRDDSELTSLGFSARCVKD